MSTSVSFSAKGINKCNLCYERFLQRNMSRRFRRLPRMLWRGSSSIFSWDRNLGVGFLWRWNPSGCLYGRAKYANARGPLTDSFLTQSISIWKRITTSLVPLCLCPKINYKSTSLPILNSISLENLTRMKLIIVNRWVVGFYFSF